MRQKFDIKTQRRVKTTSVVEEEEDNESQNEETYFETDVEMDEMWRESDDSDDDRSEADSEVNPGRTTAEVQQPDICFRQSLMLVSSKAPHENVSERELREMLQCSAAGALRVVKELREVQVLLQRRGSVFQICPQTALQVLD